MTSSCSAPTSRRTSSFRSEEHTSELQSRRDLVCRLLLEKKYADIKKSFGGVPVLNGITLHLEPGTVTALAVENGAGKSTLMQIFSGQYIADACSVSVQGNRLTPGNTRDAVRHGVAIVPQELASIEDMTVYENLFVGREFFFLMFRQPPTSTLFPYTTLFR